MPIVKSIAIIVSAGLVLLNAPPAGAAPARIEIPITQLHLSDGMIRYSVPVDIGAGPVDTMLDTGSVGLRIMAAAFGSAQYEDTGVKRRYAYGSGVALHGPLVKTMVRIGAAATGTPILIQRVESVDCTEGKSYCPAARVSADDFRIGGDGLSDEGYKAIMGVALSPQKEGVALNPLNFMGAQMWMIRVPLPAAKTPGSLILNPTPQELAGVTWYKPVERPNPDPSRPAPARAQYYIDIECSRTQMFNDVCGHEKLDTGARDGLKAFFTYSVVYDQQHGMIGLKLRPDWNSF